MNSEIRNDIDKIWMYFFNGGVTNPLTVIEQITYLMFIKGLDDRQIALEKDAALLGGIEIEKTFKDEDEELRWSVFKDFSAERMYQVVQTKVFPFIKNLGTNKKSGYAKYMKDAMFIIPTPLMLQNVVTALDKLEMKNRDIKGDVYEYMLGKLSTAGRLGAFRTPRHIVDMMVELMKPTPTDIICDPAAGSSGFLVQAGEYLRKHHSSLFNSANLREHFNNTMFYGFDMDITMLRIGAMNLMQHGIENPNVDYKDSLSQDNEDTEKYSLILANPPFTGAIDKTITAKDLLDMTSNTSKTELLFLALFLRILKIGGRCACIVPDGVLFGSSKAHKSIRKELIEKHKLEAVISMPSGVFKPYAGVSTAILIFTKTNVGGTDNVWFYDMKADGFSLDDQRQKVKENDIPDIKERFKNRNTTELERARTEQSFVVPKEEIVENDYDLSINKYKEIIIEKIEYEKPEVILKKVVDLENEIQQALKELEGML